MVQFHNLVFDKEIDYNCWEKIDFCRYVFKLKHSFQSMSNGSGIKIFDMHVNNSYPQKGMILPDKSDNDMYFLTDIRNGNIEITSNVYRSSDVLHDEHTYSYYYYIIPWFFIPKNYLDFDPRHIIMMFNMSYLIEKGNGKIISLDEDNFHNKYYNGINMKKDEIEMIYCDFVLKNFTMEQIIRNEII